MGWIYNITRVCNYGNPKLYGPYVLFRDRRRDTTLLSFQASVSLSRSDRYSVFSLPLGNRSPYDVCSPLKSGLYFTLFAKVCRPHSLPRFLSRRAKSKAKSPLLLERRHSHLKEKQVLHIPAYCNAGREGHVCGKEEDIRARGLRGHPYGMSTNMSKLFVTPLPPPPSLMAFGTKV